MPRPISTKPVPLSIREYMYPGTIPKIIGYEKGKPVYQKITTPPKAPPMKKPKPKLEIEKKFKPPTEEVEAGRLSIITEKPELMTPIKEIEKQINKTKQEQKTIKKDINKQISSLKKFRQKIYTYSTTRLIPSWQQRKLRAWMDRITKQIRRLEQDINISAVIYREAEEIVKEIEKMGRKPPYKKSSTKTIRDLYRKSTYTQEQSQSVQQTLAQSQRLVMFLTQRQEQAQQQKIDLAQALAQVSALELSQIQITTPALKLGQFQIQEQLPAQEQLLETVQVYQPRYKYPRERPPERPREKTTPLLLPGEEEIERRRRRIRRAKAIRKKYKEREFKVPTFVGALEQPYKPRLTKARAYKGKPYKGKPPKTLRL